MIDNGIRDLINRAIDGECSAEESLTLQSILRSNAEARKLHADLQALVGGMAVMAPVEPPSTLKPGIMRALDERRLPAPRSMKARHSWLEAFSLRPILAFAGGAVAGIAIFVLASGIVGRGVTDTQDFAGSLILHGSADVTFRPGNVQELTRGASTAVLETSLADGLAILRIRVKSPEGMSGAVRFDPAVLHIEAVQPMGAAQPGITIRENELVFGKISSGGVAILYSSKPGSAGTLHLTLSAGEEILFNDTVSLQ